MNKTTATNSREETPKGEIPRGLLIPTTATGKTDGKTTQHPPNANNPKTIQAPMPTKQHTMLAMRTTHQLQPPTHTPTIIHHRPHAPLQHPPPPTRRPHQLPPSTPKLQHTTIKQNTNQPRNKQPHMVTTHHQHNTQNRRGPKITKTP